MTLRRLKLRPTSPWRTPWQADTLAGMLCWACARADGADVLRREIIDPALAGEPSFVLSDAFPGDLLPIPLALRLHPWPADDRKRVKRCRWLGIDDFQLARRGELPPLERLIPDDPQHGPQRQHVRQHNTLGRDNDTTGDDSGLFARPETLIDPDAPGMNRADYLSVYFRARPDFTDRLLDLFGELSDTGFGADAATGRGQFDLVGDPDSAKWLDLPPPGADAVISLSTFQPGPDDPTVGLWEAFTKFGKLGPDFALDNAGVAKHPLVLFRPGACFRSDRPRALLGRAVPMDQLLPAPAADELRRRGIDVIHPAFALAVPARLHPEVWS